MLRSASRKRHEALSSAPGFNFDILYEHSSRVKSCCWQGKWFLSLDQQALHIWSRGFMDPSKIETHQIRSFPINRAHFISAVTHASPTGAASTIILAACLDHTLKIFADSLKLRSSIAWHAGVVTMMVYNTKNNTLITAGSAGVKLWESTANSEDCAEDKALPAADGPWLTTSGCIVPWCYGRYQTIKEKLSFQVPGLTTHISAADVAVPTAGLVSWCSMIQLITQQQLLLVMFQADVYGFDAVDGTRLHSWRALAEQPLVDMVYISAVKQLVTASREPTVVVRQLQQDGSLAWVACLGRFAAGVHCVAAAADRPWLLTASLDGFVVAWSTDNWQQLFRMKLPAAVSGIQSFKPDQFFCLAGNSVRFFKISQAAKPWMTLTSPLASLESLSYGLLLATFADSSIRVLDAGSSAADKAAITTVPQLSSASLLAAAADLPGARLFALLTSGQVHVWDLHLTKPPVLAEVWSHLSKEKCCSMAFLDGTALDSSVAQGLGLSIRNCVSAAAHDEAEGDDSSVAAFCSTAEAEAATVENHVFIGTSKGEVLVCDASRKGLVVLRVPAIKLLPVSLLLLDADLNRMVVAGGKGVRIWDLTSLTCIAEFEARSQLLSGDILEGRLLLGSACGRCYMLDLVTGKPVVAAAAGGRGGAAGPVLVAASAATNAGAGSSDHDGPVNCIRASCYLQHYVTCSQDGYVKVFDRDGFLKAAVYLAAPLAAAAFLNDNGDLLVAPAAAKQLMVVPAATYAVTPRTKRDEQDVTIFDELRGKGVSTPRALMHNMTCRLQALATTPGKTVPISRYPVAAPVTSLPATPTAANSTNKTYTTLNPHKCQPPTPLNPAMSPSTPPWGLASPLGLLNPECSLIQPDVIQSSTRPPVDLEQNRIRAEAARINVPECPVAGRQSTIARAILYKQQQQQQQPNKQQQQAVVAGDARSVQGGGVDGDAAAIVEPAAAAGKVGDAGVGGAAVVNSRLSRMARGANITQSQQQQHQQQEQQVVDEPSVPIGASDQPHQGLLGFKQQQEQQQSCSHVPVKQLPAAFAKLSVDTGSQQADTVTTSSEPHNSSGLSLPAVTQGPIRGDAPPLASAAVCGSGNTSSSAGHGWVTAHETPSLAAAGAAEKQDVVSSCKGMYAGRSKQARKLAGSSSSVRWNSSFQFDLKALEAALWKRNLQKSHRQDSSCNSSDDSIGDDGNSSDIDNSSRSSNSSGQDGSDDSNQDDDLLAGPTAVTQAHGSNSAVAAACATAFQISHPKQQQQQQLQQQQLQQQQQQLQQQQLQQQPKTPGAHGELFTVGQLKIKAPFVLADGNTGAGQRQQVEDTGFPPSSDCHGGPGSGSSSSNLQLKALSPAMRRTVPVVQDPDVFMEDVPVPAELHELLQRYQADMVTKQYKKKTKKQKARKADAQGNSSKRLEGNSVGSAVQQPAPPAAAAPAVTDSTPGKRRTVQTLIAGSKPGSNIGSSHKTKVKSKGRRKQQQLQPVYTSALDYLIHTASDPTVITELKVAELHDSKQAALAKQWKTCNSPTKHSTTTCSEFEAQPSNRSPCKSRKAGVMQYGSDSSELQRLYKMLKKYQAASSRGKDCAGDVNSPAG